MILHTNAHSIAEMIKTGVNLKAYTHKDGWDHEGLVNLAKHYGLDAKRVSKASSKNLAEYLDQEYFPIISIKWAFENKKTLKEKILFWKKYGGHLVLVIGYEKDEKEIKGFYVNHPSIKPDYNWENKFIPIKQFKKGFKDAF